MSWTKKNQVQIRHRRRNMEENPFSALINMQRNDVNQRPVSYTHLDVYKRQMQDIITVIK